MTDNREIQVTDIKGISIGHASNQDAGTGVTVLYFPNGAKAGCDISGGGPASRETPLTSPLTADNPINAIVLSGGSAYGLAASDGVMTCLEEHGIGYPTGLALVPLVCQSCIYDLGYKSAKIRPDAAMGREATENALAGCDTRMGNIGAGCGATVGKLYGMGQSMKAGLGLHCIQIGSFQIGAIVAVNAAGDIYEAGTGKRLAGLLSADRKQPLDSVAEMCKYLVPHDQFTGNTTIGAVFTNAAFSKAELNKIASMTRNAYARCISPVGTMADGDSIYAASIGSEKVDINVAGTLAASVMQEAIRKAVESARIPEAEFVAAVQNL